jgi:carbon storage regulator
MLVLSRGKNESIVVGGPCTIMVVRIGDDKVRLGIQADPAVPIHRSEVHRAIQRDKNKPKAA